MNKKQLIVAWAMGENYEKNKIKKTEIGKGIIS